MASNPVTNFLNASSLAYGQNATSGILLGELDSAHKSTLSGYWVNYPTPWPYLLITVAISIGLGWLGFQSSAKSWHPVRKGAQRQQYQPANDTEMSDAPEDKTTADAQSQPQFYTPAQGQGFFGGIMARQQAMKGMSHEERRAFVRDRNNNVVSDAERAAHANYAAQGQSFDPDDDIRPDGGVGKFRMYKAIFGIAWTTLRSVSLFILACSTAHNAKSSSSQSSYPGPLSVMILFASAQTYLASRGMPRIFNVILAWDLLLIWIALVISSFGPGSTTKYYAEIGVQGGNCPFLRPQQVRLAPNMRIWPMGNSWLCHEFDMGHVLLTITLVLPGGSMAIQIPTPMGTRS